MTQALSSVISTWSPASVSIAHRVELRNVRQGGNDFLAAVPLALQSFYAGTLMSEVYSAVSGPFAAVAGLFWILYSGVAPVVSLLSCAVKEGFFEQSVRIREPASTRFYEVTDEEAPYKKETVTLRVGGVDRHFLLGPELHDYNLEKIELDGKWFHYNFQDSAGDTTGCREVEIRGRRRLVQIQCETSPPPAYIDKEIDGVIKHFELGAEVKEPHLIAKVGWADYRLREIPQRRAGCVTIRAPEQNYHYDTGLELDAPTSESRSFWINGVERHYASVKFVSNQTIGLSGVVNYPSNRYLGVSLLPTRLDRWAIDALIWINRNGSQLLQISILVASVALLYFGQVGMALGAGAALIYEYLDHDLGVIPQQTSLFMEKWLPTISSVGLLFTGSLFSQIVAASALLLTIPSVQLWLHYQVASAVREIAMQASTYFQNDELRDVLLKFPPLSQFDAPLIQRKTMNRAEIATILEAKEDQFELNPAVLTKPVELPLNLEENTQFSKLLTFWDRLDWVGDAPSNRIFKRLIDDKRFIQFVQTRFPEAKRFYFDPPRKSLSNEELGKLYRAAHTIYVRQFQEWIQILADEQKITPEQFMANWTRQQLVHFVNKINITQAIEGEQRYLRATIENMSHILPFLLREDVSKIDLEDTLLKLAIEGGNYCSLGMSSASMGALQRFIEPVIEEKMAHMPPNARFEHEVFRAFLKGREMLFQMGYNAVYNELRVEQNQDIITDVHLYTAITRIMKRGLYPMTEEEKENFSLLELLIVESIGLLGRFGAHEEMMGRIPENLMSLAIDPTNLKGNRVLDYLRNWVEENAQLARVEKDELLNGQLAFSDENLIDPDMHTKWYNLFLNVLGIYREKLPEKIAT